MRAYLRPALAACAGVALLATASACGNGSTVDNADNAGRESSTVPSVSSSTDPDKDSSEANDHKEDDRGANEENHGDSGNNSDSHSEDGGVQPVDEIPANNDRSEEEKNFLHTLEENGVNLKDDNPQTRDAVETQIISAGYQHCENKDSPLAGVVAGQLQTQGALGKPDNDEAAHQQFEKAVRDIQSAADQHLCG